MPGIKPAIQVYLLWSEKRLWSEVMIAEGLGEEVLEVGIDVKVEDTGEHGISSLAANACHIDGYRLSCKIKFLHK